MDFKECHRLLSHLGAKPVLEHEYRGPNGSRKKFDLDLFTGVTLPFSCDEWCALCMNGGSDYLGGCCGSLSAVQDRLNATFRGDGYITTHHLKEIIEILNEHGDLDSEHYPLTLEASRLQEVSQKALDDWYDLGVLEKLAVIWHLVKDHMTSRIPTSSPEEGAADALSTMVRAAAHLNAHFIVQGALGSKEPSPVQLRALYRLWPSLKTVYERFHEMHLAPMTGWAMIDITGGPEALCREDIGACFYHNLHDVRVVVREWVRSVEEHKDDWGKERRESFQRLAVRPVRISVEHGLEFLPGDIQPLTSLV